jgi:hypothetical protein
MAGSAVMMAWHVASRAARDTLFLSSFHVSSLPPMVAGAAGVAILAALLAARAAARLGPARSVPLGFLASAALTLVEWGLVTRRPDLGAIAVYLHVAALGPVLLSGFWSVIGERIDPRSAKQALGRIAAAGTLGGMAGGLLAERLSTWAGISGTLPALALAHLWCAWNTRRLPGADGRGAGPDEPDALPAREAMRRLRMTPYLRNLALLVLGSSVSVTLLDYVFKAQTSAAAPRSVDLMRVFSAFYAGVGLLTFALQSGVAHRALQRAGVARTVGTLPGTVMAGGVAAALFPGPWMVGVARGLEAVVNGSLFRTGYELLYTPIPPREKRATKALVDVGCERAGDAVGAGLTVLGLGLLPGAATPALLGLSVVIAGATLAVVARIQRGYVSSLEAGLRAGAVRLDQVDLAEPVTRGTLARVCADLSPGARADDPGLSRVFARPPSGAAAGAPAESGARAAAGAGAGGGAGDPIAEAIGGLRSGDAARVRATLAAAPLDPALVATTIRLLGRDDVAAEAAAALARVAARHPGQYVDALLDPDTDFAVRRRLPGVIASSGSARAVDGLTQGLADARFEVRYRCGRALARLLARDGRLAADRERVFEAVRREAMAGRAVWDSHRLLDQLEERDDEAFVDEFLRDRAGRSLEHAFTLLSLVLPREPLQIAFRGLHAGDPMLRGTALEYLESVLPPRVREVLWPYLEPDRAARRAAAEAPRDREQVLDDLMRAHQSIRTSLEELGLKPREAAGSEGSERR